VSLRHALVAAVTAGIGLVGATGIAAEAAREPIEAVRLPWAGPCKTVQHGTTEGIVTTSNGEAPSPTNPPSSAVLNLRTQGVEATLPDALAKALFLEVPSRTVKLNQIGKLSYRTYQLVDGVALWSYQLPIDINGGTLQPGDFTTLVYEPYQDNQAIIKNQWQNWDVLRGGNAKWWSTHSLPGVPSGATQSFPTTWSTIVAALPNATVLAYGADLGKGTAGASSRVDRLVFGAGNSCVTHRWSTRYARTSHHISILQWWRRFLHL
jgi:hypothetical protein